MGKTAEEKSRARYAEQLGRGLEPRPLNDVNRAILAEVRAEVQQGKRLNKAARKSNLLQTLELR